MAPPMPSRPVRSAQQDDPVAGAGASPGPTLAAGLRPHGAHLHVLGHIAGVVDFAHHAGGQPDLVAVGGVARRGGGAQLPLGQLALQGLVQRGAGVAAAGDAHGLMDIGPAGQGSRMAPPMQVAAPPKGSISVGWLWVSFLNMSSQSCSWPSTVAVTWMEQALISSDSSSRCEHAPLFQDLGADGGQVHQGLGPPAAFPRHRPPPGRRDTAHRPSDRSSRISTLSMWVEKVVWRQWSDQ